MTAAWVALSGGAVGLGVALLARGLTRTPEPLGDALRRLDGVRVEDAAAPPAEGGEGRLGAWAARVLRIPLLPGQERQLALRGKPREEFLGEKVIYAILGLVTPGFVAAVITLAAGVAGWMPAWAAGAGGVAGFFLPDLMLSKGASQRRTDAGEALFTFFDLVTLERLANRSSAQALATAAALSDIPLFVHIREAVERARLEQRPPWEDLARLGQDLGLAELVDLADVMRLDETGAALSGVLRARVRELRDAHLTRLTMEAHAVTERMTLWMTLPALIFGLIFLAPPLLRMIGG